MNTIDNTELTVSKVIEDKRPVNKINVIGCNNCHKTNVTLIKATDSYYCKPCFLMLGKKKFNKKGGRK